MTTPEKLVMVTSLRRLPHHTFESNILRVSVGMLSHSLAAEPVNFGMDSIGMNSSVSLGLYNCGVFD